MIDPFLNALGADGPFLDRAGKTDDRRAEVSADNGKSWRVVTEFTARRKP